MFLMRIIIGVKSYMEVSNETSNYVCMQFEWTRMQQRYAQLNVPRSQKSRNSKLLALKKTVHYRVYKCPANLHVPMGRVRSENSASKLDNDANKYGTFFEIMTIVDLT